MEGCGICSDAGYETPGTIAAGENEIPHNFCSASYLRCKPRTLGALARWRVLPSRS